MNRTSVGWPECAGCEKNIDIDWATRTCLEMGTNDCVQQKRLNRKERHKNPEPMPSPVVYYSRSDSKYPETIRMSFADGHTEIYDRRVNQPRPGSYINEPARRRRRK